MANVAELNARHAAKMAARRADPSKCQTYPANRGAGSVASIGYRAKLEARVAAFNAGRRPDASGYLEVGAPKAESKSVDEPKAVAKGNSGKG